MSDEPNRQFTKLELDLLGDDAGDDSDHAATLVDNTREFTALESQLFGENIDNASDNAATLGESTQEFTVLELGVPGQDSGNGCDNATTSAQNNQQFTKLELELLGEDTGNGSHDATSSPQSNLPAAASSQRKPNGKAHPFDKIWSAKEHPQNWTDEEREERFLIKGRRAGMSASQFLLSPHLKGPKYSTYDKIRYQFDVLSQNGVDIKPRTEEYRRRCQQMNNTPLRKEAAWILQACQSGMTPKEIQKSGMVRCGSNELNDIKQRIYKMKQRGKDVAPRSAGQTPRPV
ncbi:MAG: hypothetical protein Q9225_003249 [Loekoesia sp. 1 TL-2023]